MDISQWWQRANMYQIYPRSFCDSNGDGIGDIPGIVSKLDYLKDLGIDALWLSPVYKSPNDDNGYDISDYYTIHPEFGTNRNIDRLIKEMHKRKMRLVMDLVVNHCSDEHPWFKKACASRDDKYHDYFIWHPGRACTEPTPPETARPPEPNNWASFFRGSAWQWNETTREYYLHLFSRKQPDLNWENPDLREEIYAIMRFWLDRGVDGFRMDVINFISKDPALPDAANPDGKTHVQEPALFANRQRTHEHLKEMNREVLSHYPECMTIGEMHMTPLEEGLKYVAPERNELSMIFQFEHLSLDHGPNGKYDIPTQWRLPEVKEVLGRWQTGVHGRGWNSLYTGNHDQPRIVSRLGDDGEFRTRSAQAIATAFLLMQGTPFVYQGEEIGMTNVAFPSISYYRDIETINFYNEAANDGVDPEQLLRIVHLRSRDNSRTPMQWSAGTHGGFTTGVPWIEVNPNYPEINVQRDSRNSESMLAYTKRLLHMRRRHTVWTTGAYVDHSAGHDSVFCYERRSDPEAAWVLVNMSGQTTDISVPNKCAHAIDAAQGAEADGDSRSHRDAGVLLANLPKPRTDRGTPPTDRQTTVKLAPWQTVVVTATPLSVWPDAEKPDTKSSVDKKP